MQSIFGRKFGIGRADRLDRNRKARSRRLAPSVDGLEHRALLTGGVGAASLSNGVLTIVAPQTSGNTTSVSIDAPNNAVKVTVNGNVQEFSVSQVTELFYVGGANGGDTYTNSTSILSGDLGYGGDNSFTGGTGADVMFFYGNGNSAIDTGGLTLVYTNGGQDNVDGGALVLN
jgi:hypothetical protein